MKVRLPYVQTVRVKGKTYGYYRRDGQRQRIPGDVGTAEWIAAYHRIHAGFEAATATDNRAPDALARVVEAYRASPDFAQLGARTRSDYDRYLDHFADQYGQSRLSTMPTDFPVLLRDKHAATPAKANAMLRVLSVVCAHAEARASHFKLPPGWRNPAKGVRKLRTGPGHRPWEDTEVEQFRTHWPPDTPQRVAFELLLNTGQRGGDVIAMVRQQYHAGVISLTQAKTGVRIDVPASKSLRAVIDPWLATHPHMVILTGPKGKGLGVDYFRHMMRAAYSAAALPTSCTTHGLRYTAATVMRELGLDWDDIAAVTGHKTTAMVRKYTAKRRRAARAIARLDEAGV